jgi:hypothetical protein
VLDIEGRCSFGRYVLPSLMLRHFFLPRLWWLLLLPLAFYLTRMGHVNNPVPVLFDNGFYPLSTAEAIANKGEYAYIDQYEVMGMYFNPNKYQIWQFVANACLVIGCLSVGKQLFFRKPSDDLFSQ